MHLQPPLQVKLNPTQHANSSSCLELYPHIHGSPFMSEIWIEFHSNTATKPHCHQPVVWVTDSYGLQIPMCTQIIIYLLCIINDMVLKTLIKHLDYTVFKSGKVLSNNVTRTWQHATPKQKWDAVKGARWACVCVFSAVPCWKEHWAASSEYDLNITDTFGVSSSQMKLNVGMPIGQGTYYYITRVWD